MSMKKCIMSFPEFETKCNQWFDKNEKRYLLSDLRIWRIIPGSYDDNDVWYCVVKLRHGVNMMMMYDHSGELDEQFEVFVDWGRKTLNIPSSQGTPWKPEGEGYTTSIGTFTTIDAALAEMTEEPTPYRLSILNDSCSIGKVLTKEEKQQNIGMMTGVDYLSFLECLDILDKWRKDDKCQWKGRMMTIFRANSLLETIYTTQL